MGVTLERTLAAALALTVVAFASGSAIVQDVLHVGRPARWIVLLALLGLACAYALGATSGPMRGAFLPLTVALVAVALASTLWSVDPRLTLERACTLAALAGVGTALLYGSRGRVETVRLFLLGLLVGMVLVALFGLVVLAVSPGDAIQPASTEYPARFRGFGQNPNTVSLLLALGVPLALLLALDGGSRRLRLAAASATLLFAGSITASASRGAMLGALAGALVLVLVRGATVRRRVELAAVVVGAFGICVGVSQIPDRKSPSPASAPSRPVNTDGRNADRPLSGYGSPPKAVPRTLFGSSGRSEAWRGAVHQVEKRPIAGYGFGTEELAFVDRYPDFASDLPENSFIGTALQIGLTGLALLLAVAVSALAGFARSLGRLTGDVRATAAACAGVAVAALVLGLTQSYLLSVGNIATASAWLCMFLLVALTRTSDRPTQRD